MLTVTQAAEIAKYDPRALRKVIEGGRLAATKLGAYWVIIRSDLETWMASDDYHTGAGRPRKEV